MNASRPNQITIERRSEGPLSPTGSPSVVVTTLNASVPARITLPPHGELQWLVEGSVYVQAALLIIDGLDPLQFSQAEPGETVSVNGITYTVSADGLMAFPSLSYGDRVTDEEGTRYLVLAVERYALTRTLQAQIARGRSW